MQYTNMAFNILYVNQPILAQQQRSSFITCLVPSCDEKWFQSICLGWGISQGAARTATKVMWQVIKESCANQLLLVEDHFTLSRNIISTPHIIFPTVWPLCNFYFSMNIYTFSGRRPYSYTGTGFYRKAGVHNVNFCDEKQKGTGTFSITSKCVKLPACLQSEFRS